MTRDTSRIPRRSSTVGLLLVAGLLLFASPAFAQVIKVTSAVPSEADQGTLGLVVTIGGDNFVSNSKVAFYVTGTKNTGGIAVKGVKFKDSKTLEATIDVAPDAQTEMKFDVQVMSGSRTGKGTELFKVLVKVTGGDTTPPGMVTDLQVVESQVGFNTAGLSWTAPADDGADASSGQAVSYELRVRKATPECGPYTMDIWVDDSWTGVHNDPCHVYRVQVDAGSPGATESQIVRYLSPNTKYWAALRYVDDGTPEANWSDLSTPMSFTTGPFPATPWSADIPDWCPELATGCLMSPPRFDFDGAGNPVMVYDKAGVSMLASWTGSAWNRSLLPPAVVIDHGNYNYDFAFDPAHHEATISTVVSSTLKFYRRTDTGWTGETIGSATGSPAIGYDPLHFVPTIAYRYTKGSRSSVRIAERSATAWTSQDVGSQVAGSVRLAFDDVGNTATAFVQNVNGAQGLGFALREGGAWSVELAQGPPPSPWTTASDVAVAFDPLGHDFAIAGLFDDASTRHLIQFCTRANGVWGCETVATPDYFVWGIALAFGPDGTAYLAYTVGATMLVAVRAPNESDWSRVEHADWNYWLNRPDMRIGPDGQPAIAYRGANGPTGAGGSDGNNAVSLARRIAPAP